MARPPQRYSATHTILKTYHRLYAVSVRRW